MKADFKIHSGWGDHIDWLSDDWSKIDMSKDLISVVGHLQIIPKVGQTLMGEFKKSFIKFEFVSVKTYSDPSDMFSAQVKAIDQEMK